ncbi:CidA/LrgA family protein [Sphaerochaeta sp. PS]|uniref:CidA/LrgA family protein n=1 Tax=Sphaerochaeta sp. PS TaxID=3076336 RepID=UPI0028A476ED|nr:CidA/LrgA family protein [Sphaerochaeta sp. PS]MDT4761244.1 CidA/LrgA family protein [Sphaerochaeta sp. PS]
MKILIQLALIFGICILGDLISSLLPFAFPGSVVSMLLMVLLLLSNLLKESAIEESADFFLKNMTFFFIPFGVGILRYAALIQSVWWQLLVVNLVSLLACFAASSWTVVLVSSLQRRWRKKRNA